MTVPVVWHTWNGGAGKCCWDMDVVEQITARPVPGRPDYQHIYGGLDQLDPDAKGAVIVTPARFQVDHLDRVNADLARLDWVVLILTSDEEALFPWRKLDHPNLQIWVQSPRPDRHPPDAGLRFLPVGAPAGDRPDLPPDREQPWPWMFAGQANHHQRDDCLDSMAQLRGGHIAVSPGFTQGIPREMYLGELAKAKVAPAPSGPASADTFRVWEALEMGAIPIVDRGPVPDPQGRAVSDYPDGFWSLLLDANPPFPVVDRWPPAPLVAQKLLDRWPASANRSQAWWQTYQRDLACRLVDDVAELSGTSNGSALADLVTVLVPTSPIPSHPSTAVVEETLGSIRERLPGCEIVLMLDGVRREQEHRRTDYEEYQRRLLWLTARAGDVLPVRSEGHLHQANMTRRALNRVRTPLVLFVEHDTPLVGEIPFDALARVVMSGAANVIRLYPEAELQPAHAHLMPDGGKPVEVGGVPMVRTVQWSQRPHLASTGYYRRIIGEHFRSESRTMVEDLMHGMVQDADWGENRVWIYHPPGGIKRSTHLDGRGGDPKFEMVF